MMPSRGLRILFFIVVVVLIIIAKSMNKKNVENFDYHNYSQPEYEKYYRKSVESRALMEYFVKLYKDHNNANPKDVMSLVTEGYLKELPKEYLSSREGSNLFIKSNDKNAYKKTGGWMQKCNASVCTDISVHSVNLDMDVTESVLNSSLEDWYQKEGKNIFSDIIIKEP